jgi:DNA-binding transcriptional ArsR family regulator
MAAPTDEALIRALASPLRRQILGILAESVASPKEIADRLGLPLPNVSYHVGILRDLGLLELVSETPRRGAIEHHYRAEFGSATDGWHLVAGVLGAAGAEPRKNRVRARSVRVDAQGRSALQAAADRYWRDVEQAERQAQRRMSSGKGRGQRLVVGTVDGPATLAAPAPAAPAQAKPRRAKKPRRKAA